MIFCKGKTFSLQAESFYNILSKTFIACNGRIMPLAGGQELRTIYCIYVHLDLTGIVNYEEHVEQREMMHFKN